MGPADKAQLSADWLALLRASTPQDPWVHGFSITHRQSGESVGRCGFKGPPAAEGAVEIAYGIDPAHQGNGYATEAAEALVLFAFGDDRVRVVRAHTLPHANASTRVLTKCGFRRTGEVVDPEDVEMLEDLIKAAFNEAARLVDEELGKQLGGIMPPGMPSLF